MAELLPLDPPRRAAPIRGRRSAPSARALAALLVLLALAALPPIAALLDEPFLIRLFTRVMVMAIAAMSLDLILGFGGMVSLGHAAFVGIGAYVVGILSWHATNAEPLLSWPIAIPGTESAFVAWPAAVLAAALAALAIGLVSLRTSGVFFIMITLAFAQMLYFFFIALQKYGGDDGLQLMERSSLGPVDLGDPAAKPQLDETVVAVVVSRQRHLAAVPVFGVARQADAVVGGVGLLGQHGDPPRRRGIACAHRLDEPVADHAVADHDHMSGGAGL